MKILTTLGLTALAGLSLAQSVTVTIHRVKQIDDLDHPTLGVTKDRADFRAQIWIDGKMWTSPVLSKDDGKPNWKFSVPASRKSTIRIKLIEDDGGLERKDDYVDINPKNDKKDLVLWYNKSTKRFVGDVNGRMGRVMHTKGGGDSSKGEIWFTIS